MPYHRGNTVPCRYCLTGWVRFFAWFKDKNGTIHRASDRGKRVFAVCENPDCLGPGGQYNLDLAA